MPNYMQNSFNIIKGGICDMEYGSICSRKNEKIIQAAKLSDKKHRDRENLFFIEGAKLLQEAIIDNLQIVSIFFTQSALEKYSHIISQAKNAQLFELTNEVFEKLTCEEAPQGIFTIIKKPCEFHFDGNYLSEGGFLILEDVQNPMNIGAIFRCAYSLGIEKIILTKGCADVYNPKALRGAMGSIFKCKFEYCDSLHSFIEKQQSFGNRVICTTLSEQSLLLGDFEFNKTDSFIIGNEGNGISEKTISLCDSSIIIPMLSGAESLNAATACAVVLWEKNKNKLLDIHKKGETQNG